MDIEKILKELPPSPTGLREWVLSSVVRNTYLIYNSKKKTCCCTRCGNTFGMEQCIDTPVHNVISDCPCCGCHAVYKASGIGRKSLMEMTRTLDFARKGKSIYGVLAEVNISFEGERPEISRWISAVYKFNAKEQIYIKHYPGGCWGGERWTQHKSIRVPAMPRGHYYYPSKREGLSIYVDNFDIFKKSDLKYSDVPYFFNLHELTGGKLIRYMDLSLKYQSIELLRKAGFERLVFNKVGEMGCKYINWRGKTLQKILKMNMDEIRKLREADITVGDLEIYAEYKKQGVILEMDEISIASGGRYLRKKIEKVAGMPKVVKYMGSQNRTHDKTSTLNDYDDYIKDCRKLGLDLRRNRILFPENFHDEHIRLTNEVEAVDDKKIQTEFKQQCEKVKAFSGYEFNGLTIRVAISPQELREESAELNHCVKGHSNRVARGQCYIFFIRKIDSSNTPFYTLELVQNEKNKWVVDQCRGKGNCSVTEEIQEFVDKWITEAVDKPNKRKKAA